MPSESKPANFAIFIVLVQSERFDDGFRTMNIIAAEILHWNMGLEYETGLLDWTYAATFAIDKINM